MKPVLICLVGRGLNEEGKFESSARVGKDEVARIIARNYETRINPFALPFKQTCQVLFGLPDDIIWDDNKKFTPLEHWGITPRQMYQRFGTEGGRQVFGDTLWVDMVMKVWDDVKNGVPFTFNLITEEPVIDDAPSQEVEFDFILQRAAQIMFHVTDTQVSFSRVHDTPVALGLTFDEITHKLKTETLPAVLQLPTSQAWDTFKMIRSQFPTVLTASAGPYGIPPRVAKVMVVNDGRFFNELAAVRSHDGHVCYIERVLPATVEKVTNHASETELAPLPQDSIIKNDGTMAQLETRTLAYVDCLQESPGQDCGQCNK